MVDQLAVGHIFAVFAFRTAEPTEHIRRDGRRQRGDQWRGGNSNGADEVPVPTPEALQERGRGDGYGRRQRGINEDGNSVTRPQRERPANRRGNRQPPVSGQSEALVYQPAPVVRADSERRVAPPPRSNQNVIEQPA